MIDSLKGLLHMIIEDKRHTSNDEFKFDENLIDKLSKESYIYSVKPMDDSYLDIKLKVNSEPFVSYLGDPSRLCHYILKNYMTENYDLVIEQIFNRIKRYGKFINIDFNRFTKLKMNITLAHDYKSIENISSLGLHYSVLLRTDKFYSVHTDINIVFEGESVYDFNFTQGDFATLKMVVNYNDLNVFFLKFIEAYRNEIAEKLDVDSSTDVEKLLILVDMILT